MKIAITKLYYDCNIRYLFQKIEKISIYNPALAYII